MNKLYVILTAGLLCGIVYGAQDTSISNREVRDPHRLEVWLEANASDTETRVAAIEGGSATITQDTDTVLVGNDSSNQVGMAVIGDVTISQDGTNVTTAIKTGVILNAATVAVTGTVTLAGSATEGLDVTGTYTGNAIDLSDATIDPTGANGPAFIRLGTYAAPFDYGADNDQSGVLRLHTTCSGDISSYDRGLFMYTETTGAKAAFPIAGLAEANNTGTGPKKLQAGQLISHLGAQSTGATLATAVGDATAGMYALWAKVTASGTAVCSAGSKVAAIWLDNQMSGTVSGEEYGIFATTGASVPDAFVGFETTSSGYDQLFEFDETYTNGAGTCVTTDAVPTNQTARMKVWYDGEQYYIPLYK